MKLIGVDIDGTLLPLKGRRDDLDRMRAKVHYAATVGDHCILITSRDDPTSAQRELRSRFNINLNVIKVSRDWPSMKGEWLVNHLLESKTYHEAHLWDDEPWYLNPANAAGVRTCIVKDGKLLEYTVAKDYVPWVPKREKPAVQFFGAL